MIPKYPFRVEVTRRVGQSKVLRDGKSFETLASAADYADKIFRVLGVRRVQVFCILDDRSRAENGAETHFNPEPEREGVR